MGSPDNDDAYYPIVDSSTIPWVTKICALEIHTRRSQKNSPRCFLMARRKEYLEDMWEDADLQVVQRGEKKASKGSTPSKPGKSRKVGRKRIGIADILDNDVEDEPGAKLPAIGGIPYVQYRPGSWIGGLYECPGLTDDDGISCTEENAIPILPLMADNPLTWWSEFPDSRHYIQRVPLLYTYDKLAPYEKKGLYWEHDISLRLGVSESPFGDLPPNNWYDYVKPSENYSGLGYIELTEKKNRENGNHQNKKFSSRFTNGTESWYKQGGILPYFSKQITNSTVSLPRRLHLLKHKTTNGSWETSSTLISKSTQVSRLTTRPALLPLLSPSQQASTPQDQLQPTATSTLISIDTSAYPVTTSSRRPPFASPIVEPILHKLNSKLAWEKHVKAKLTTKPSLETPSQTLLSTKSLHKHLSPTSIRMNHHPLYDRGDGRVRRPIRPVVNGKVIIA
ncbi:hypothetical protein AWJ20_4517 [Sugiyamaella lignohabitans]|uniref:Uncharacterized protein n=1 Tax=Sugiyamaella lignohabitans TaxID=796027 RepID=A0A167CHA9_9ASCO|nr:uncharacterized protein AWJ20_4517 [Sugiyamaella lignohabitans]ANB11696.1 hypothetical protein AWJ20_4517 [Sugiyamaella lignohabitans]